MQFSALGMNPIPRILKCSELDLLKKQCIVPPKEEFNAQTNIIVTN